MEIDAKELTNMVNALVDKRIAAMLGPGWAYGKVTAITEGNDTTPNVCSVQLDGISDIVYNCVCLSHVMPMVNDYVLTVPVNGYAGDRVIIGISKQAYENGALLYFGTDTLSAAIHCDSPTYSTWTWYYTNVDVLNYTPPVNAYAFVMHYAWWEADVGTTAFKRVYCRVLAEYDSTYTICGPTACKLIGEAGVGVSESRYGFRIVSLTAGTEYDFRQQWQCGNRNGYQLGGSALYVAVIKRNQ